MAGITAIINPTAITTQDNGSTFAASSEGRIGADLHTCYETLRVEAVDVDGHFNTVDVIGRNFRLYIYVQPEADSLANAAAIRDALTVAIRRERRKLAAKEASK